MLGFKTETMAQGGWSNQKCMKLVPTMTLSRSPKNKYLCEESASLFHHLEPLFIGHWQARLHIRYTPQTPHPEFSSHRQPPPEEGGRHSSGSNRLLLVPSRLLDLRTIQTATTWQQLLSFGKIESSQYETPRNNKTRPSVLLTRLQYFVHMPPTQACLSFLFSTLCLQDIFVDLYLPSEECVDSVVTTEPKLRTKVLTAATYDN